MVFSDQVLIAQTVAGVTFKGCVSTKAFLFPVGNGICCCSAPLWWLVVKVFVRTFFHYSWTAGDSEVKHFPTFIFTIKCPIITEDIQCSLRLYFTKSQEKHTAGWHWSPCWSGKMTNVSYWDKNSKSVNPRVTFYSIQYVRYFSSVPFSV